MVLDLSLPGVHPLAASASFQLVAVATVTSSGDLGTAGNLRPLDRSSGEPLSCSGVDLDRNVGDTGGLPAITSANINTVRNSQPRGWFAGVV